MRGFFISANLMPGQSHRHFPFLRRFLGQENTLFQENNAAWFHI